MVCYEVNGFYFGGNYAVLFGLGTSSWMKLQFQMFISQLKYDVLCGFDNFLYKIYPRIPSIIGPKVYYNWVINEVKAVNIKVRLKVDV